MGTPTRSFYIFGGRSLLILGSEDMRRGGGIGVSYARPEARMRFRHTPGDLVLEAYADYTSSIQNHHRSRHSYAAGVLALGRWPWSIGNGNYFELGWGFQLADKTTRDLDLVVNSTPVLGIGTSFNRRLGDLSVGLRLMHISNANLNRPNNGQNQLYLVVSKRF